jgi:bifunctional DNA-binding transcriptional regulator/antitoxin component of YhaV-PrlF toxin-antitoxin module
MPKPSNKRKVTMRSGSLTITIPPAFAAQLRIEAGTILEIFLEGRRLEMEVVSSPEKGDDKSGWDKIHIGASQVRGQ